MPPIKSQSRALALPSLPFGWLLGFNFDATLIIGVAVLALTAGIIATFKPSLFETLLLLDLWFLGYHHVVATFTRLAFDVESFQKNKFLVIWLPLICVIVIVPVVLATGPWILATTYLYWQWYHYMRQGYGIARIYQRKADPKNRSEDYVLYALPIAGILYRSCQKSPTFLGMELKYFPVPEVLAQAAIVLAVVSVVYWIFIQIQKYQRGELTLAYPLFVTTHLMVFATAYIIIPNIDHGWLVINVWHNAQYILFVWMFNNKRFKDGVDPNHRFLSTLSQRQNQLAYYLTCIGISTVLYTSTQQIFSHYQEYVKITTFPLVLIFYQTINFHHYIVDGIIWKIRQKPIQQTLGIS